MTTTTKTKKSAVEHEPIGELIETQKLYPSPTNPRKRFPQSSIDELAISIKEQGIIEPLIVRLNHQHTPDDTTAPFEIVCGERRWRAATQAGLQFVPCIVRMLSDTQVLDIQIHENLHREDVHPMDEAFGYKFLRDRLGCDIKELALRVGKSEGFVLGRLKLNDLIDEIRSDVEANILPIGHAMAIAKFPPQTQAEIYQHSFQTKWDEKRECQVPDKTQVRNWSDIVRYINNNVLYQINKAPFDAKATNLHPNGLTCSKCPDRTGVNRSLFPADEVGRFDQCLLPSCWHSKKQATVDLARRKVAEDSNIRIDDVPLFDSSQYWGHGNAIGYGQAQIVPEGSKVKDAKNVFQAVCVDDKRLGEIVVLKQGFSSSNGSTSAKDNSKTDEEREAELDQKRQRKEEIFDMMVADMVRKQVFRRAAETFADSFTMTFNGPDTLLPELVAKLWWTSTGGADGTSRSKIVQSIMREITDEPGGFDFSSWDNDKTVREVTAVSDRNLKIMLFLFVHGNKGNTYFDRWSPQTEVRAIADHYNIDYRLLDAQCRVRAAELKAKKQVDQFKTYLAEVEAGKADAKIPRVWSKNWKPEKR